jgi:MFS family permease
MAHPGHEPKMNGPHEDEDQKNIPKQNSTDSTESSGDSETHVQRSRSREEGEDQSRTGNVSQSQKTGDSIYTAHEKWIIVSIIAVGGLFSPLTANVYLPAIPAVADAFHKSVSLINLTVTVYMIFQGMAPMFWGTLADYKGRRPIYLMCLLTLTLSCVGLALTPTNAYWLLMVLRCLQAAGSASTIALGAGVIGDITRPEERGGMYGLFSIGPVIGPAIAPVIGGVISQNLGWRYVSVSSHFSLCLSIN